MQENGTQNQAAHFDFSFAELASALSADYESIFVIDSETDKYVEYRIDSTTFQLSPAMNGSDFYEDTIRNTEIMIYPDDREYFRKVFRKESFLDALAHSRSFSLNYRLIINGEPQHYFLKTIRGAQNSRYILIGVRNVNEEIKRQMEAEKVTRTYSAVAKSLASLYEVIYFVDVTDDTYIEYTSSDQFTKLGLFTDGKDFFRNIANDSFKIVHPEDQKRVQTELSKEKLLSYLETHHHFGITHRQFLAGRFQFVSLIAFQLKEDHNHIVVAVRNIDEQKRREIAMQEENETYAHIAKSLSSRYEVIYYINIDTNAYTEYSSSDGYAKLGITQNGTDFFQSCAKDIRDYIHPDDQKELLQNLEKAHLLEALQESGTTRFTYRQLLEDRSQYVTMMVVQPRNDKHHIIMAVFNVDAQMRREQAMANKNQTFEEIIKALARRYEVIYYVNLHTNEYQEFCSSDKYAKLEIGVTGQDFFTETQRNIKHDIYSEDYPLMAECMTKEHLLESMDETGTTTINYRLMLDGEPQFVTLFAIRPKEDSQHIIIAVANVDAAKRREMAYRDALGSAIDMASRDALTGVKNKHAYVQTEIELDNQIDEDINPDFAIVIHDINGLKHVNDTQGHSAGDMFIKSACMIICKAFQHSPVYRIGGDEFAVVLRGQDYEHRFEIMQGFRALVNENAKTNQVTVASGMSEFIRGDDLRVQDVFERADHAMYTDKKMFKAKHV